MRKGFLNGKNVIHDTLWPRLEAVHGFLAQSGTQYLLGHRGDFAIVKARTASRRSKYGLTPALHAVYSTLTFPIAPRSASMNWWLTMV